ncbi:MAG: hypothetical protein Q8T08_07070, partial [Ignavibacteria bacterium]|nr:hypothetical protein [Ignavibacteria bacterium]
PLIWYIALILFTLGITVTIFAILTKYAFYEPNSRSGAASIFQSIGAISVFIPLLLPLVWVLSVKFYFNAIQKLNPYLHDFD